MKKLLLLLLLPLNSFAQPSSNYFAIATLRDISKQEFYAGSASRTTATNSPDPYESFISGYIYPTNFTAYTTWTFPPRIITTTNAIASFHFLTTNTGTTVAGDYRIVIYTNNIVAPAYDSGDIIWLGIVAPANTNIQIAHMTNNFPTNFIAYTTNVVGLVTNVTSAIVTTNITSATISVKVGPISGQWYSTWITEGKLEFQ